jgi:hypothetical protein
MQGDSTLPDVACRSVNLTAGSYVAAVATLAEPGHPVIAGFTVTTSFIIYLAKPTTDILRQNVADHVNAVPEKNESARDLGPTWAQRVQLPRT